MGHSIDSPKKKVTAMSAYMKNTERSQINDLKIYLGLLEKQRKAKPKRSRREIIRIRAKIIAIETKNNHTKNQQNKKLIL
jgi:hypothetical protein